MNRGCNSMKRLLPVLLQDYRHLCVIATMCIGLAACGKDDPSSVPVVKVNGQAVTAAEVISALWQENGHLWEAGTRDQVVGGLIDRKLLQAEALRNKLDRDPTVVLAMENAKATILAQAYLQSRAANVVKPTRSEVASYFQKHSEYFLKQKTLDLIEMRFASTQDWVALKTVVENARSLDDVAAWFKGHQIRYTQKNYSRHTADMPPAIQAKFNSLKKGQLMLTTSENGGSVIAIDNIRESPLALDAAAERIEHILLQQRSGELAELELTRLRSIARLEYPNGSATAFARDRIPAMENRALIMSGGTKALAGISVTGSHQ